MFAAETEEVDDRGRGGGREKNQPGVHTWKNGRVHPILIDSRPQDSWRIYRSTRARLRRHTRDRMRYVGSMLELQPCSRLSWGYGATLLSRD